MGRLVIALALISLAAAGCAGSQSEPQGQISVVVSLSGTQPARHYTLRCGPAGGTVLQRPSAEDAERPRGRHVRRPRAAPPDQARVVVRIL
jgi:hypothetical protein